MNTQQFEARKRDHIRHSLDRANQAIGLSGLEQIHLIHQAFPEIDFNEIQIHSQCLGRTLATPFYVAGMTAGHPDAFEINRTLALACEERGWAMGVGSQRRELERVRARGRALGKTTKDLGSSIQDAGQDISQDLVKSSGDQWRKLREEVPQLVLFANLGLSQLIQTELAPIRDFLDEMKAQALAVHVNSLQEAMQPEGTPQFRGGLKAVRQACESLGYPILVKETGCGFSSRSLRQLAQLGLAAIDVSGLGGTHWGRIEGARAQTDVIRARASQTFSNWGESTVESLLSASEALPDDGPEIWASGGVRSGLDAAKLIALGAQRVGYAQPALEAALAGPEQLRSWMETQEYELKVALFCTGSVHCQDLREKEGVWRKKGI